MKLFGKKKETKSCCCGENCTSETMQNTENKKQEQGIKILGSAAVSELRLDYEIEHVTDFAEIAGYGVMTTPALVFNGEVISYGKVLTVEEVKALLSKK